MRSLLVKSALIAATALAFAGAASAQSPYGNRGGSGYGQGSGSGYGQPSYRGPAVAPPVAPPVYVGGPRPPVYVPSPPPGYGPGYGHGPRFGHHPHRRWHRWHGPRGWW